MRGAASTSLRRTALAVLAVAATLAPAAAAAQNALPGATGAGTEAAAFGTGVIRAELLGGMTIGSHSRSAAALDMDPSVSLGVGAAISVWRPDFSVFAGYIRTSFGCEEGYCTSVGYDIVGNHAAVGAEWGPGRGWLRAGLMFGTVTAGEVGSSPNFGIGVLGAAGIAVGAGKLRFKPGATYRWMQAATETEPGAQAIALGLEIGFDYVVGGD